MVMLCYLADAAWSNWSYGLNISSADGGYVKVILNIKEKSYYIDDLQPNTTYDMYIVAYK